MFAILGCIFSHSRSTVLLQNFQGEHAPGPPPPHPPLGRLRLQRALKMPSAFHLAPPPPPPPPMAKMLRGPCVLRRKNNYFSFWWTWLHLASLPQLSNRRSQNVLPRIYAHRILWPPSFMHNNTLHSDADISKGQRIPDWQCYKESRLSHKQESHTDDTCGHHSISASLVVIFYCDAAGRILEGFYIFWGAFSQDFLEPC